MMEDPHLRTPPMLDGPAYIHPTVQVYGAVSADAETSLWPHVVIRAEMHTVHIGRRTNLQDFVMVHVGYHAPTLIGADCSVTHHCTLHGCTLGDRVLVGIGSTIMDGCVVGDNSIIAGHSFLKEGTVIPPNSIVMGAPAKVVRQRNNAVENAFNAWLYHHNALAYARGDHRGWTGEAFEAAARVERARLEAMGWDAVPPGTP